jgi:hypothetical protein
MRLDKDRIVDKMIEEWDKVKCVNCGKEISILTASTINQGEAFVCKDGECFE